MTRALYFFGGVVTMALIPLAQSVDLVRPWHAASIEVPAAASAQASTADPVATAVEDLAAWPAAAIGR